jgi:RimJ/RimL family protein N-acetyltransferase
VITPLESPRLLLRPLRIEDAEQVQQIFPHWEIVRYLTGVEWPYPDDGALRYYRDFALPGIRDGEEWHWTLRLRSAPEQIIGQISLMTQENNNRGFWLGLPWQRQRYMTEAVEAATDYWFGALGFPVLRAPKAVANTRRGASRKQAACASSHLRKETMSQEGCRRRSGRSLRTSGAVDGKMLPTSRSLVSRAALETCSGRPG